MKTKIIGSLHWGIQSSGNLSSFDKINFALKVISMRLKKTPYIPINIDPYTIKLPDSKLVKQAIEYIDDIHETSIKNHCLRAFVLGELFGQNEKLYYDKEVFALSAILHDIGLEDDHCCLHKNINCFAIEGAIEAGLYLKSLDKISDDKITIIQDAISLHLNIKIPNSLPEAYLLNKASGTDTIGYYSYQISKETISKVMEQYPRLDFNSKVHQMLKKQCEIRPKSR
ncbi:MAG: hypothetical protein IIC74_11695, partial [Bacteroidetes bacterium]|nr:hypothetical protein [Bacteroidota bacterium]